ncbi:hypothetical protein ACQPZG_12865 [Streptomyces sp. CA-294286]|uniref:hypothetical protein n=1 Tax=Streptomyces sp. CA-294286 TaxID=3240070 RepID=UPI003D9407B2
MKKMFARIAVTGAAVAATLAATATPALADSDITLNNNRGYMTYKDSVDVFEICDMNPDGHGVHGLLTKTGTGNVMHIDDGGDAGCDKQGYNVDSAQYRMSFFWDGGGKVLYSKYFSE